MNKDVAAKMINGASIVSVAVIVKIPITDIKRDSFSTATEKSLGPGDGFRSTRETGLPQRNFSVIGKSSGETRRYQRIYSDNNSESKLSDIVVSRLSYSWIGSCEMWRMGGDSNPRCLSAHTLSRRAQSTTLSPIQNDLPFPLNLNLGSVKGID